MANETISILRRIEGKEYYNNDVSVALTECQREGNPLFMNDLIEARINSANGSRIWKTWYTSPSIRATGKTAQGNAVVVYAHRPNYFSNPKNILDARKKGLVNGAGYMPQKEFQKLIDLDEEKDKDGNRLVWIIDYETLKNSGSGVISVDKALEHPQTIPFIGGEQRAVKYLEKHKENYGEKIGNWYSDDLKDKPTGRLLYVGNGGDGSLSGDSSLDCGARFVGVKESAEGTLQKIIKPTHTQIIKIAKEISLRNAKEFEERIKNLF